MSKVIAGYETLSGNAARRFVATFALLGNELYKGLLAHGEEFQGRVDSSADPLLAAWVRRKRPRPKHCFGNAQDFCLSHPEAKYYEGYWQGSLAPVPHGWVVLGGMVIDFTTEATARLTGRDTDPARECYFGMHVPTDFIARCVRASQVYQPLTGYYLHYLATGEEP